MKKEKRLRNMLGLQMLTQYAKQTPYNVDSIVFDWWSDIIDLIIPYIAPVIMDDDLFDGLDDMLKLYINSIYDMVGYDVTILIKEVIEAIIIHAEGDEAYEICYNLKRVKELL
jgi:hypothetical protein